VGSFKGIEDLSSFFINGKKIEDQELKYITPARPENEPNCGLEGEEEETPLKERKAAPQLFKNFEQLKETHCYCIPDFQKLKVRELDSSQKLLSAFFQNINLRSFAPRENLQAKKEF